MASINDVYSSSDGVNWSQVTKQAAWSKRYGHATIAYDNQLWGGYGAVPLNDVWRTSNGRSWRRAVVHAAWSPRVNFGAVAYRRGGGAPGVGAPGFYWGPGPLGGGGARFVPPPPRNI